MQGHAFMGKHETKAQEYAYGFRGRMDERYDLVRSVVGENSSTYGTTCPINLMANMFHICSRLPQHRFGKECSMKEN